MVAILAQYRYRDRSRYRTEDRIAKAKELVAGGCTPPDLLELWRWANSTEVRARDPIGLFAYWLTGPWKRELVRAKSRMRT